jgi:hypothetical protein
MAGFRSWAEARKRARRFVENAATKGPGQCRGLELLERDQYLATTAVDFSGRQIDHRAIALMESDRLRQIAGCAEDRLRIVSVSKFLIDQKQRYNGNGGTS